MKFWWKVVMKRAWFGQFDVMSFPWCVSTNVHAIFKTNHCVIFQFGSYLIFSVMNEIRTCVDPTHNNTFLAAVGTAMRPEPPKPEKAFRIVVKSNQFVPCIACSWLCLHISMYICIYVYIIYVYIIQREKQDPKPCQIRTSVDSTRT